MQYSPQAIRRTVPCVAECEVTVIIPTLNEEKNIGTLLAKLFSRHSELRVIVADDLSNDGTAGAVNALQKRLLNSGARASLELLVRKNAEVRGITASVVDAVQRVQTEYFVVMDGDLQHPVEVIEEIMQALSAGADLVAASRRQNVAPQPLHRVWMTRFSTQLAALVLRRRGFYLSDPMSGLFGAKTELMRAVVESSKHRFELAGYKVLFDFLRCVREDILLSEVFYDFRLRSSGGSKLRPVHAFYFLRSLLK